MVIVADVVPGLKRLFGNLGLSSSSQLLAMRMVVAFLLHAGRMSCMAAAGMVTSAARHRAQLSRFLARPRWRKLGILSRLQWLLLAGEDSKGLFIFIVDATMVSRSGKKAPNTFSTGNRKRRPVKKRRYGKYKHARKNCHSFTIGLLLTPSGRRVPFFQPYYTRAYCQQMHLPYGSTADAAARMIRQLPLAQGTRVIVLGDSAYEAASVQEACRARGYSWICPINPERRLAGRHGTRRQVRSMLKDWSSWSRQTIRFVPSCGPYAVYRRLSRHRIGPKTKPRTYYVHQERQQVHSVGEVRLLFSTTENHLTAPTLDQAKILMSNDLDLTERQIVELYCLRWQIELLFKELKSTLGLAQYRFQNFPAVEGWVELTLATFAYLEHHRALRLQQSTLSEEEKRWWQQQRTFGLCQAIHCRSEQNQLQCIADRLRSPGGIRKLKQLIRNSLPKEYRAAA